MLIIFSPSFYDDRVYALFKQPGFVPANLKVKVFDSVTEETLTKCWNLCRMAKNQKTLFWFDDCMGQKAFKSNAMIPILINCRHNNASVVALTQEVVGVNTNFRRQCEGFMGFQTMDFADREQVFRCFGMGKRNNFMELYDHATEEDHSFLYMNRQGPTVKYYKRFTPLQWHTGVRHPS